MAIDTTVPVAPVAVGDVVAVVDETRGEHLGLVTAVHGRFDAGFVPCINVVYVVGDEARTDNYGRQTDRLSSLQHVSQGPSQMPDPGRFWVNTR